MDRDPCTRCGDAHIVVDPVTLKWIDCPDCQTAIEAVAQVDPEREIQHLGSMNDWPPSTSDWPSEYRVCRASRHILVEHKMGRCISQYVCNRCGLAWLVDSSD